MSSKPIYPHVPYFYVIEHVASGKRYAGCRYAKGCNPVEFMQPNGYQTSSPTVSRIVKEEGLGAFVVIEIKTIDEVGDVYAYETKFLKENDCAASEQWINGHNNTGMTFGTEEFKEKAKRTFIKNYGVDNPLKSKSIKEKSKQTCVNRYGVENPSQSKAVKEQKRRTCLNNHGVECSFQSEEVQEKSRQTMLKNHGVEYTFQSEEFKEKSRQTCLKNHGVEHSMQSVEVLEKSRQTCLKNHGVDYYGKTKESRERTSKLNLERFDSRVKTEILNGDFSRFVYLYDTTEHVFLMGVEKSLNRGLEAKRYIKITTNEGSKTYLDVSTGKTYKINSYKFSVPIPDNFVKIS